MNDSIRHVTSKTTDHTIGFAVRSTSNSFRIAKLFFDLRNLREYDFAGNRQNNAIIGDAQIRRSRQRVEEGSPQTIQQAPIEDT